MPEMISYKVTQTREVDVVANSLSDAVRIASQAFDVGQNSDHGVKFEEGARDKVLEGVWGNTTSKIRATDISVREGY